MTRRHSGFYHSDLSFPENKWLGYLHSSEGHVWGGQWCSLTRAWRLNCFHKYRIEPGEASHADYATRASHKQQSLRPFIFTGSKPTKTLPIKPGYGCPAKLLLATQQITVQIKKAGCQPWEQLRIPKVNGPAALSPSFPCDSHGDLTELW